MKSFFPLFRFNQWPKNLVVVVGGYFADSQLFLTADVFFGIVFIVFASGLVSSANYILNDYTDRESDMFHPVKHCRKDVFANISFYSVGWIFLALLAGGLLVMAIFSLELFFLGFLFFLNAVVYNIRPFRLKDVPVLDVSVEALNLDFRFLIGWITVSERIYPSFQLLAGLWFFGFFLMSQKRYMELASFKSASNAIRYRKSFAWYSRRRLLSLGLTSLGISLILFYKTWN